MKNALPLLFILSFISCRSGASHEEERFAPCPDSPNCVSSLADQNDNQHYIVAFNYASRTRIEAKEALHKVLSEMKRVKTLNLEDQYEHYIFITPFMRFKDDVEFLFPDEQEDPENTLIHIRSASRLGHSDLGVNRRRMEEIRYLWRDELGLNNQ